MYNDGRWHRGDVIAYVKANTSSAGLFKKIRNKLKVKRTLKACANNKHDLKFVVSVKDNVQVFVCLKCGRLFERTIIKGIAHFSEHGPETLGNYMLEDFPFETLMIRTQFLRGESPMSIASEFVDGCNMQMNKALKLVTDEISKLTEEEDDYTA